MHFRLDRTIPIPLAEQVKGQITYAISYGHLAAGQALPSVRELSATLGVAPMTVSQVYRDLVHQGLVVTRPGAGTFVADITRIKAGTLERASHVSLQQLADSYVRQAALLGHGAAEIQDAVLGSLERAQGGAALRPRLLMIGNFAGATDGYAREIENVLQDMNVAVIPILLAHLQADPDRYTGLLGVSKLAVTLPTRLQEVRELLEPRGCPVAAIAFRVSIETRRRLAAIAPSQKVGIVTTYPEFMSTIVENVAAYGPVSPTPLCAVLGQDALIKEMLAQIDVLVYASGSEAVCDWLPARVDAIEFRHNPEPDSVNRLRPLLV